MPTYFKQCLTGLLSRAADHADQDDKILGFALRELHDCLRALGDDPDLIREFYDRYVYKPESLCDETQA